MDVGLIDDAVEAYQKAIECEKTNSVFYRNLAGLYIKMGQQGMASQVINEAVNLGIADEMMRKWAGVLGASQYSGQEV